MRQYEPIWKRIKEQGSAVLECPPGAIKRLRKAVIKEKDEDKAFKMMNDHDKFRLQITYDRKRQRLKFELLQKYGLEERVVTV